MEYYINEESQNARFLAIEGKYPAPKDDYTEAFDLAQRLDSEITASFDCMAKFANRIANEDHRKLEDVVGELQEAINDARLEVQKRLMDVFKTIAENDICE